MKTITFYSYKGGVGRSLALANIALRLAEFGRKVCLLDFDLEAPGLHFKFPIANQIKLTKGIVDYIYEFTNSGILPSSIKDYSLKITPHSLKTSIDLIPAGNIDSKEYWHKVSSINWQELLYKNENGLAFLLDLKEKIKKQLDPEYLLIDSRTGISEMSGITLSLLADEIVVVAANNKENLYGCQKIIESISNPKNLVQDTPPKVTFVLSRVPFTDNSIDKSKEQSLISKIKRDYLPNLKSEINIIHSDRELEENERIKIGYEKDASTAQISRDYLNLFEQLTQNDFTSEELAIFKNIKKAETLFLKALSSKSSSERMDLISRAISLNSRNYNFYYFRAMEYYNVKEYEKAKNDISQILNKVVYLPALELLGEIQLTLNDLNNARKTFENILKINPKYYNALTGLGLICYRENMIEKSIEYYTMAIEISPEIPFAYNGRGNSNRILEKYDEALTDIYKALELDPNFAIALATLAEIKAGQGKINEFYLNLEMALILDAENLQNSLSTEKIYKQFILEERFQKLLEKYNLTTGNFL
ncbi:MAG: AAA family ATPase [Chitinophagaceae bacterium]|nr:AAA family ATPase [Chitinophagaceae bacterium]MBP9097563.1 AAA family ATPase [Ferruginibacter sp.]